MRDPQRVIKVNFGGAATVVDAATEHQTPLLMVSSSEVAGKYRGSPFSEDTDRLIGSTAQLRWTYAEAKALAEQYALAAHRQHGLPVVIVRPFNVVGPGQTADNGMVIPTFFRQALSGEPITVIGDGSQHRSFSYVDDVVEAFVNLLREPRAHGLVVNVGADQPVSILELAQRIRRLTRSSSPITFVSYEEAYGLSSGKVDNTQETPEAAEALAHWGAEVLEAGALEAKPGPCSEPDRLRTPNVSGYHTAGVSCTPPDKHDLHDLSGGLPERLLREHWEDAETLRADVEADPENLIGALEAGSQLDPPARTAFALTCTARPNRHPVTLGPLRRTTGLVCGRCVSLTDALITCWWIQSSRNPPSAALSTPFAVWPPVRPYSLSRSMMRLSHRRWALS